MTGHLARILADLGHHLPALVDGWRGSAVQIGLQCVAWWVGGGQ